MTYHFESRAARLLPTGVGQDIIQPGIFPGTDGTPLLVDAAILPGIEPRAIPPGIPWDRMALRYGSTLPHFPWYNTRTLGFHISPLPVPWRIFLYQLVLCKLQRTVSYRLTVSRLRTKSATPGIVSNKVNSSFSCFFYIYFSKTTYFSETISSYK